MKRVFVLMLLSFLLVSALSVPAQAAESYLNVYPYLFHSTRVDSFELLNGDSSLNTDTANLRNLGVYTSFDYNNLSGTYIVNMSFSMYSTGWSTNPVVDLSSVRPYKLYLNYTDSRTYDYVVTFDFVSNSYKRPSDQFDFYYTKTAASSSATTTRNFVNHNINFIIKDTFHLDNIYLEFTTDVNLNSIGYTAYGPTVIKFDTSSDDILAALGSISSSTSKGFQDLVDSVVSSSASSSGEIISALQDVQEAVKATEKAINDFEDNFEEHTENALDSFKEKLQQEATEKMNDAIQGIEDQLNLDVSTLSNSIEMLYNSITTDQTDAVLTLPAGHVSIAGQEYTFWEAQNIDFSEYFAHNEINMLLYPLRFLIYIGFGYYLFGWIKKVENIVTMHEVD